MGKKAEIGRRDSMTVEQLKSGQVGWISNRKQARSVNVKEDTRTNLKSSS